MKHPRRSCVVDSGRANFYGDVLLWGCAGEVRRGSDWGRSKGGSCANCGVGILTACGIMNSIRLGWIEIELRIYGCVKRPDFTTVCFHPMKISLYHSPLFHFFFFCFYDRSNPIQSNRFQFLSVDRFIIRSGQVSLGHNETTHNFIHIDFIH